jgi:hypothetical protein
MELEFDKAQDCDRGMPSREVSRAGFGAHLERYHGSLFDFSTRFISLRTQKRRTILSPTEAPTVLFTDMFHCHKVNICTVTDEDLGEIGKAIQKAIPKVKDPLPQKKPWMQTTWLYRVHPPIAVPGLIKFKLHLSL